MNPHHNEPPVEPPDQLSSCFQLQAAVSTKMSSLYKAPGHEPCSCEQWKAEELLFSLVSKSFRTTCYPANYRHLTEFHELLLKVRNLTFVTLIDQLWSNLLR